MFILFVLIVLYYIYLNLCCDDVDYKQDLENKMEGIEFQGGDEDYIIVLVGFYQSFVAMVRCVFISFSENYEGLFLIFNLFNIQVDKIVNYTFIFFNIVDSQGFNSFFFDQQNLRYI